MNALTEPALAAGVEHVVFSSVAGADTNRVVPHHRVETHLRDHAPSWTILRPGFFAQNLADAYRRDIVEDDRIYLPAGNGRVAFIDTRDIGDVAGAVFADPAPHRGKGYTLTGPRAVTFDEVASDPQRHPGPHHQLSAGRRPRVRAPSAPTGAADGAGRRTDGAAHRVAPW